MKKEVSAGGIIIKRRGKSIKVLVIKDMNGNWTFPKGLVEKEELHEDAAIREIYEETGVQHTQLIQKLSAIRYMYQRNGLIQKTVYYFLFELFGHSDIHVRKEEGISDAKWVTINQAKRIIGYPKTNLKLLDDVQKILQGETLQSS